MGFPGGARGKELTCQGRRLKGRKFNSWVGKIPWRRVWLPPPVFFPGESHGQWSLVGYSPWGRKQSDTAERPILSLSLRFSHGLYKPLELYSKFNFHQKNLAILKVGLDILTRPKFGKVISKLKNLRATPFYEMKQKAPKTAQNETLKLYINCIGTADFCV